MKATQSLATELSREVPRGKLFVWWLGQAGFVLKLGGKTIYIDPFFSLLPGRLTAPPFPAEEATTADYVLGTHDHVDHIDRPAWSILEKEVSGARFFVPQHCRNSIERDLGISGERLVGLSQSRPFTEGELQILSIPAAHEQLECDAETGEYAALGYVIKWCGFTIYHAGDCCIYEGLHAALRQFEKLDLMLLPINGRSGNRLRNGIIGNMSYQEAVDLAGALEPRLVLPMHFDAFSGNTEDPALFIDYLSVKYPRVAGKIPQVGERMVLTEK